MTRARTRLDAAEEQQALPVTLPAPAPVTRKPRGGHAADFTGAGLLRDAPETYAEIVRRLADDETHAAIARGLGVSRNTVASILHHESAGATLEQLRARARAEKRTIASLARQRMREMLTDPGTTFRPRDLVALATVDHQSDEQAELLSGGATQRVEHVQDADAATFDRYLATLRRVPLETDCGEQTRQASRGEGGADGAGLQADGGALAPAGGDPSTGANAGGPDDASEDCARNTLPRNGAPCLLRDAPPDAAHGDGGNVARQGADAGPEQTGGEGVRRAQGGDLERYLPADGISGLPVSESKEDDHVDSE